MEGKIVIYSCTQLNNLKHTILNFHKSVAQINNSKLEIARIANNSTESLQFESKNWVLQEIINEG